MKYQFYEDPGHGWLKVKRTELKRLGISGKISGYSYQAGGDVYLEEDMDLSTFVRALENEAGRKIKLDDIMTISVSNHLSPIRNYDSYKDKDSVVEKSKPAIVQGLLF